MSETYSSTVPTRGDAIRPLLGKILQVLNTGTGTGTGAVTPGNGSPEGVTTANPGSTYLDLTGYHFWVKATGTGNTGWVELIE